MRVKKKVRERERMRMGIVFTEEKETMKNLPQRSS